MLKAHLLVIDPQNDFADILAGPLDPVGLTPLTARDSIKLYSASGMAKLVRRLRDEAELPTSSPSMPAGTVE
jgi:hypothetical protein